MKKSILLSILMVGSSVALGADVLYVAEELEKKVETLNLEDRKFLFDLSPKEAVRIIEQGDSENRAAMEEAVLVISYLLETKQIEGIGFDRLLVWEKATESY